MNIYIGWLYAFSVSKRLCNYI